MTTYTTINSLVEAGSGDLEGTDYFIISTPNNSYKVTLDSLNTVMIALSSGTFQEITNAVINDITNVVNANAVHLLVSPEEDILKGVPVSLVIDNLSDLVKVKAAISDDVIIGLAETDLLTDVPGAVMTLGILDEIELVSYTDGDTLYWQNGAITSAPVNTLRKQIIGYVLNGGAVGKLLISTSQSSQVASDIGYNNATSGLVATEVQSAIDEITGRLTEIDKTIFKQGTPPSVGEGATEGDTWYDTSNETFNVYRENLTSPGTYAWKSLIFHEDIIDGGSWNVMPLISMTSHGNGVSIELDGTAVLQGTYDVTDSTLTSLEGTWVSDAITFALTDLGGGTWEATGLENGDPTFDNAQSLSINITTADTDSVDSVYTGITPSQPPAPGILFGASDYWGAELIGNQDFKLQGDPRDIYGWFDLQNVTAGIDVFTVTLVSDNATIDILNDGNIIMDEEVFGYGTWERGSAQWSNPITFNVPQSLYIYIEADNGSVYEETIPNITPIDWV